MNLIIKLKKYKDILGIVILIFITFSSLAFYINSRSKDINKHSMYSIGVIKNVIWNRPSLVYEFTDFKNIKRSDSYYESSSERYHIGQKFKVKYSYINPNNSELLLDSPIIVKSDSMEARFAKVTKIEEIYEGHLLNKKLKYKKVFYEFYYHDKKYIGTIYLNHDENVNKDSEYRVTFPSGQPLLAVFQIKFKNNLDSAIKQYYLLKEKDSMKKKDSMKIVLPKYKIIGNDTFQILDY